MGDLLNASLRFQMANAKENLVTKIASFSQKYTHFPNEMMEPIANSIRQILSYPSFNDSAPMLLAVDELESLLDGATTQQAEVVLIDSYLSFCKTEGWDPMDLPSCRRISRFYKHYTFMRQTVCIITFLAVLSGQPEKASLIK